MTVEERSKAWILKGYPGEDAETLVSWLVKNDGFIRQTQATRVGKQAALQRFRNRGMVAGSKSQIENIFEMDEALAKDLLKVPYG